MDFIKTPNRIHNKEHTKHLERKGGNIFQFSSTTGTTQFSIHCLYNYRGGDSSLIYNPFLILLFSQTINHQFAFFCFMQKVHEGFPDSYKCM